MAQVSAYQSTDSNSSILIQTSGNVVFNVTDTKFSAGFLRTPGGAGTMLGFTAFGKPKTSFSSQIFNASTQSQVGGTVSLGRHVAFSSKVKWLVDDWFMAQFTYSRSAAQLVSNASTPSEKRTFDGVKGMITYNGYRSIFEGTNRDTTVLFGVSAGASKSNNVDELTSVTINFPVLQSATGVTPAFQAVKSVAGYYGNYKVYTGAPIYTDVVFIPQHGINWLSVDLFTRSNVTSVHRYIEGGAGIFISDPAQVTKVLGGLTWAWRNGRPALGIVGGWSF